MDEWDQAVSWRDLELRLAETSDPRHRKLIQTVIDHSKAEAVGDVEGLMATLCANPRYHFWTDGKDWGPKGYDAVRKYYTDYAASGAGFFESRKVRIVVDDNGIVTESDFRNLVSGRLAERMGHRVDDPDGHYVTRHRIVLLWPFDEAGQLIGEDSYSSSDRTIIEEVPFERLPAAYLAMLDKLGMPARAPAAA